MIGAGWQVAVFSSVISVHLIEIANNNALYNYPGLTFS